MSLKIVVLAKQVPDTRSVGKDAMNADGTINRSALPAIFNPEDLNALEQALRLKDTHPGSTVTMLTMGPGRAAEIIREGLYRGADNGYLLTDRAFAGADTLATSYALATAIRKIGDYDGGQEKAALTKDGAALPYADLYEKHPYLNITEWSVADVNGDTKQCGLSGSPTKVKKIENIIFQAKESKTLTGSDADVENLIVELLANHTIG